MLSCFHSSTENTLYIDAVALTLTQNIGRGRAADWDEARSELTILAGLRGLSGELERGTEKMPIAEDIKDHPIIGPWLRKSKEEGEANGRLTLLSGLIRKRFGTISPQIRERLEQMEPEQLNAAALRIPDAERVEDLFA